MFTRGMSRNAKSAVVARFIYRREIDKCVKLNFIGTFFFLCQIVIIIICKLSRERLYILALITMY